MSMSLESFAAVHAQAAAVLTKPADVRELARAEFLKVWGPGKMCEYCAGKAAALAILPAGEIVVVDKQSIETDFCFGESGYDFAEAAAAAQHARTSADHFRAENMRHFDRLRADISASMAGDGHSFLIVYTDGAYNRQPADCRLRNIGFARLNDIIDACGGSCRLEDLPGTELTIMGQRCRVATREEHELILRAYDAAAEAHAKKVDAYLKRYGLSKVNAWTYWRDR